MCVCVCKVERGRGGMLVLTRWAPHCSKMSEMTVWPLAEAYVRAVS